MKTTNTNTTETNFEIGFRMQKEGYGISDSFGSALATGDSTTPTDADIEEWIRGYNAAKEMEKKQQEQITEESEIHWKTTLVITENK
jgi:hypothetical protein